VLRYQNGERNMIDTETCVKILTKQMDKMVEEEREHLVVTGTELLEEAFPGIEEDIVEATLQTVVLERILFSSRYN